MRSRELLDARASYFMAVVEEGSFSAAARKLRVSQPAISQQVTRLEALIGTPLLDRSAYRPTPTEAGRKLYKALATADDAIARATDGAGPDRSCLTIGFTGASQNQELLEFVRGWRAKHADVDVTFRKASFDGGRELLLGGEVDCCFGIGSTYSHVPGIITEKLFDYELCVICSHDNPLAKRRSVAPADIADQPFVVLAPDYGKEFHRNFMDNLRADGLRPNIVRSVESFDELVLDVSIGEGIAVVSREVVNEREVAVLPLVNTKANSTYVVARLPKNEKPSLLCLIGDSKSFFEGRHRAGLGS